MTNSSQRSFLNGPLFVFSQIWLQNDDGVFGLEPRTARCWSQTNPLSYGCTPPQVLESITAGKYFHLRPVNKTAISSMPETATDNAPQYNESLSIGRLSVQMHFSNILAKYWQTHNTCCHFHVLNWWLILDDCMRQLSQKARGAKAIVTRLGKFWNFLVTNFLSKEAHWWLFWLFWKTNF